MTKKKSGVELNKSLTYKIIPHKNQVCIKCEDVNISVMASNFQLAEIKMKDALTSYLATFTKKELLEKKHLRKQIK